MQTVERFRSAGPTAASPGADFGLPARRATSAGRGWKTLRLDCHELPPGEMPAPDAPEAIAIGLGLGPSYPLEWHAAGERERVVAMHAGVCNVTAPGHETRLRWPRGASVAILQIDAAFVARSVGIEPTQLRVETATGQPSPTIAALVVALRSLLERKSAGAWHVDALAHRLAVDLASASPAWQRQRRSTRGALDARRLARALDFIDAHLGAELCIADIAEACGLSGCHFVGSFARATGLTPHACVRRARLQRAAESLRRPEPGIADVARSAGFIAPSHFSQAFRSEFGVTPRRWRQECAS